MKKKIVSVLLALILVMGILASYSTTVSAAVIGSKSSEKTVANIYLCSNWSGAPSLGHVWVYIENTSGKQLTVGKYTLPAGEGVSVGSFALTRSDGAGVYYNVESYCGNIYPMGSFICNKATVTEKELESISSFIRGFNIWDPVIMNCVFFAVTCWNLAGGNFMLPVTIFPFLARIGMRMYPQSSVQMMNPGRNRVYKQHGIGSGAYIVVVSDGSVDTVPG